MDENTNNHRKTVQIIYTSVAFIGIGLTFFAHSISSDNFLHKLCMSLGIELIILAALFFFFQHYLKWSPEEKYQERQKEMIDNLQNQHIKTQRVIENLYQIVKRTIVKDPSLDYWIRDGNELLDKEEKNAESMIWVISPHLENDLGSNDTEETLERVEENVQRNVQYYYIIPDNDDIKSRWDILIENFRQYSKQPQLITLPQFEFDGLANTEYVIYDPEINRNKPKVFMQLPIYPELAYWAKLSDKQAFDFSQRVEKAIDWKNVQK